MNEAESEQLIGILEAVLNGMAKAGPRPIGPRLRFELEERQVTADIEGGISHLFEEMLSTNPNSTGHAVFAQQVRLWDSVMQADWAADTDRLSPERRGLICSALGLSAAQAANLLKVVPIAIKFDEATLIANEHEDWYTATRKLRAGRFYWSSYERYLRSNAGWSAEATTSLDDSTDKVLKCLSDPERIEAFRVRGLVVGYVQSGKTANFTAVIAKALDAGYRMVIVLAGVLDSLRFQTQRRLDKELVGKEQIIRDKEDGRPHEYSGDQDWEFFNSYGGFPHERGAFDVRRITTSLADYQKLGQGKEVLRIERAYPDRPLNNPDNLHKSSARLVVIKKHPSVINKLIADLKGLKMNLSEVPVLVIDDESDQASVNTINPKPRLGSKVQGPRTSTNEAIVKLLAMFERSQYIGYTATPAANTLINPQDAEDLFPRDFIELLPRPSNYMGVSDFHDFDEEFNPLAQEEVEELGWRSNRKAFVRFISDKDEDKTFKTALDGFFLTGAIKLFRASRDSKSISTRHHTMLVHRATSQDAHDADRDRVTKLIVGNRYRRPESFERIWKLWIQDFAPVSEVREPGLSRPQSLKELAPFLNEALNRFEGAKKQVLIVNGRDDHKDDMPDFDAEDVWNILVGGAKLSRGYTVEGLTITFFLRKATAADTLMQMGRWFGFRRGYRDLVRLFIGTRVPAGKKPPADLYNMFESICMDEERLRKRIAMYSREGIRPIQVPPLVPMGMLVPTQRNKMYNAEITMENFGGRVAESGRVTTKKREQNVRALERLLRTSRVIPVRLGGDGVGFNADAYQISPANFVAFLKDYQWWTVDNQFSRVLGFLSGTGNESPNIDSWLCLVLQNPSAERKWVFEGVEKGVFQRATVDDRFKVFSESRHRAVASHLSGVKPVLNPTSDLVQHTRDRQAVCLIYPTIPTADGKGKVKDEEVTIGLSLTFPINKIRQRINWRVKDNSPTATVLVDSVTD